MKIQELFENQDNGIRVLFRLDAYKYDQKSIEKILKIYDIDGGTIQSDGVSVQLYVEMYEDINLESIKRKSEEIKKRFPIKRQKDISFDFEYIEVKCITLQYKIEVNEINLDCANITSLKDIHKQFICDELILNNTANIKDSALGLLKINNLKRLLVTKQSQLNPWLNIIQNCFLKHKTVIECSEELIEKGFKEYAKL